MKSSYFLEVPLTDFAHYIIFITILMIFECKAFLKHWNFTIKAVYYIKNLFNKG